MAGLVQNGNVCAYKIDVNGIITEQSLNCGTTDSNGNYTLTWNGYNGDVILKVTSGSYVDEATGSTRSLSSAQPLRSTTSCSGATCNAAITPLTELAIQQALQASNGLAKSDIAAAYLKVAQAFGINAASTTDAINQLVTRIPSASSSADVSSRSYAQLLDAVSRMQNKKCGASNCDLGTYLSTLNTQLSRSDWLQNIQADFTIALKDSSANGVNGMKCSLVNAVMTCDLQTTPGSTAKGNYKLNIQVNANGIATPAIVLNNIDKPSTQSEFCNDAQVQSQISQIKAGNPGSTWTLNSCTFSGNTGTISATIGMTQPVAISIPYTINYTYSSM